MYNANRKCQIIRIKQNLQACSRQLHIDLSISLFHQIIIFSHNLATCSNINLGYYNIVKVKLWLVGVFSCLKEKHLLGEVNFA